MPHLDAVRRRLPEFLERLNELDGHDEKGMLPCRSFNYHNAENCGVGFHGDDERRMVISVRLGQEMKLQYQWFY